MSNVKVCYQMIEALAQLGIEEYCVCPGSRNAPLIEALEKCKSVNIFYHFDERAAGFFALGRMKRTKRPVAVVTTSGTAVMELLPAMTEAYYSNCPIVVISADRPQFFRHSGAPQVVDQQGVFRSFVEYDFDIEGQFQVQQGVLKDWPQTLEHSMHINVCFDEPLLDEEVQPWELTSIGHELKAMSVSGLNSETPSLNSLKGFKPILILSGLSSFSQSLVKEWLPQWLGPIYAEAQSGLRGRDSRFIVDPNSIKHMCDSGDVNCVVRIGDVPTLRFWRDLETQYRDLPVVSFSERPFSGLGRSKDKPYSLKHEHLCQLLACSFDFKLGETQKETSLSKTLLQTESLFEKHPLSEPSMVRRLSKLIPEESFVFLGNSLPIREWDQFSVRNKNFECAAHRGANGIDGLVAGFLGQSRKDCENWCLLGDQSGLYDLNSLGLVTHQHHKVRIVILNNGGGQIFRQLNYPSYFSNPHGFNFSGAASMFELEYQRWSGADDFKEISGDRVLIEVFPSQDQSDRFMSSYKNLWTSL